ncbi:hypothetical protein V1264_006224 [Littorina saxatilis]|uniref:EGF-like domain-containing protein n=1 Tax=Littorina saxatilis TaxID=31220 RepID=A0AAN9G494_9CAEN
MNMCHQLLLAWCLFASIVSLAAQFAWWDYFDYDQVKGDCPGFKCQNGNCILQELHCDGVPDCISGDDELDCLHDASCFMGDFQCDDGECVHAEFRCDGTADCLDYSDEANCENQTAIICKKDEMKCKNKLQCVESDNLCDGETDCADGSDEESCPDFTCSSREYHCRNTTLCIPNQWICDGTPDCEDGSDELCKQAVQFCEDFLCDDKSSCLELDAVCDRKNDCHDGSDERNDCHAKCQERRCSSGCIPKEDDVKCACGPGYVLQDDEKTCADRDECLEKFDGEPACNQICVNIVGSFQCACYRWYVKEPDQKTCRLVPAPLLVFSSGIEIRQFDLRTKTQDIVVERLRKPVEDMDVVGTVGRVFWIDAKAAYVTDMRGDAQVIVSLGLVALKAVSYDWLVDLLYLLDSFLGVVATCNLENKLCATVVTGLAGRELEDLLVDPLGKFLYWTENAFPARIMRSDLDGRDKVVFLKSPVMADLDHLTLDYPTKTLYWMDKKLGTIYRIPVHSEELGRADLMQAVVSYIPQSSAFTIVEDRVIWWAQKGGKIMEENKFSGKDRQPILQHSSRVTSLDVLHPGLHPLDTVGVRGSCSQLSNCADVCVRSRNQGFTCLCPPGMKLMSNGRHCDYSAASPMLLVGKKEHISLIPLYGIGRLKTRTEFADGLQKIDTIATNPRTLEIVFSALGQDGKPRVCKSNSLLSRSFKLVFLP